MRLAKSKFILIWIIINSTASVLYAQNNYYFIGFKDKLNNGFSLDKPGVYLSQKSIDRRSKQGISIIDQDLPITESYKNLVVAAGIEVFESSKWFNGIIIKSTPQEAEMLKNLAFVSSTIHLLWKPITNPHINPKNKTIVIIISFIFLSPEILRLLISLYRNYHILHSHKLHKKNLIVLGQN